MQAENSQGGLIVYYNCEFHTGSRCWHLIWLGLDPVAQLLMRAVLHGHIITQAVFALAAAQNYTTTQALRILRGQTGTWSPSTPGGGTICLFVGGRVRHLPMTLLPTPPPGVRVRSVVGAPPTRPCCSAMVVDPNGTSRCLPWVGATWNCPRGGQPKPQHAAASWGGRRS